MFAFGKAEVFTGISFDSGVWGGHRCTSLKCARCTGAREGEGDSLNRFRTFGDGDSLAIFGLSIGFLGVLLIQRER